MNQPDNACFSRRQKWWRTRPAQALAIALAILSASHVSAQDERVTVREIEFDPLILETADIAAMEQIGIERRLQARDPVSSSDAVWRMLQFSRPINRALRNDLSNRGLELTRYVDGIYIERVSLDQVDALKATQTLRAAPRYHPAFKLFPSIRGDRVHEEREFLTDRRRALPGRWFQATVFVSVDADQIAASVAATGADDVVVHGSRDTRGPQLIVFSLDGAGDILEQQLADIAQIEGIESISEVSEFINLNVNAASMNQSGSPTDPVIWNRGITGAGQTISIVDDGVADKNHCLFRDDDNPFGEDHRKLRDVRSQSLLGHAHSTWIAGNAAGDDIGGSGTHNARGGAWAARLVLVNYNDFYVVNYAGGPRAPSSFWDELMNAKDKGARIHNNSWLEATSAAEEYTAYADDIDNFSRKFEEHLVVAAAGYNGGEEWGAPALAKNALTVSAASNASSICSVFDNSPLSMRQKPDMAVVAANVKSPIPVETNGGGEDCLTVTNGCTTSHAAPHASALAALARQYFVDGHYDGDADLSSPTGALIKAVLINSARDAPGEAGFPSHREGWGIANLNNTTVPTDSPVKLWIKDIRNKSDGALQTGESRKYEIAVANSGSPLKITLVWMDLTSGPGIEAVSNNLDLEVTSPPSQTTPTTTYLGNGFDATAGVSKPGGSADSLNNVEQVLIASPATGDWTIRVTGTHVPNVATSEGEQGQGYALVATFGGIPPQRPTPPIDLEPR